MTVHPKLVQCSNLNERSNKRPADQPAVHRVDKAIMDFVVDMLPNSIVESDAFKQLNCADATARRLTTIPYTYKSLSSELLNCKITDTLDKMTHQESNENLDDLLKQ